MSQFTLSKVLRSLSLGEAESPRPEPSRPEARDARRPQKTASAAQSARHSAPAGQTGPTLRVLYLTAETREVTFVSGSFDRTSPNLQFDFSVPLTSAREMLAGEPRHDALVVGWSVPEPEALAIIAFAREHRPAFAIVAVGDRTPESSRQAGADDYVQRGATLLSRLPSAIEEAVREHAGRAAGAAGPSTDSSADPVDTSAAEPASDAAGHTAPLEVAAAVPPAAGDAAAEHVEAIAAAGSADVAQPAAHAEPAAVDETGADAATAEAVAGQTVADAPVRDAAAPDAETVPPPDASAAGPEFPARADQAEAHLGFAPVPAAMSEDPPSILDADTVLIDEPDTDMTDPMASFDTEIPASRAERGPEDASGPERLRLLESQLHRLTRQARETFEDLEASLREAEAEHEAAAARQREALAAVEAAQRERLAAEAAFAAAAIHPMLRVSADGTIANANHAFIALLGDESEAALLARAASHDGVVPAADWCGTLHRAAEGHGPLDTKWRRTDGTVVTLAVHVQRLGAEDAADAPYQVIAENLTERRALERQLARARRWESVAKVTTELAGELQQAARELAAGTTRAMAAVPQPEAQIALDDVRQQAARLEALSNQLVSFARRESREPLELDLNEAVRGMEALLRRIADEHVDLEFELSSRSERAQGDRGVLGEALMGLTMAACTALPAGGRVVVGTATRDIVSRATAPASLEPGAYGVVTVRASGWGLNADAASPAIGPLAAIGQSLARMGGALVVTTSDPRSLELAAYLALAAEAVEA